jgi:hypothetical protein
LAACLCGCGQAGRQAAEKVEPAAPVEPTKSEATPPVEPLVKPTTHVEPAARLAAPAMTKDQIAELVKATVAEEVARQASTAATASAEKIARDQRESVEAAERAAREEAEKQAAEAAAADQRDDEAVARVLLLPSELNRVEQIKKKLESESIWGLTLQDLDFATQGLAAPLLRQAMYTAAERHDAKIELDVLAQKAKLTPDEKIEMASMPPIERQQLLMFAGQMEKGQKTANADRYMREYVVRYPFVRKIVLEFVRKDSGKQ